MIAAANDVDNQLAKRPKAAKGDGLLMADLDRLKGIVERLCDMEPSASTPASIDTTKLSESISSLKQHACEGN